MERRNNNKSKEKNYRLLLELGWGWIHKIQNFGDRVKKNLCQLFWLKKKYYIANFLAESSEKTKQQQKYKKRKNYI